MAHEHLHRTADDPVVSHEHHGHKEPGGLTSYALVRYTFLFLMTVVVLYFLARFIVPLLR